MTALEFQEIEHKFLVGEDGTFDLRAFRAALEALGPVRHATLRVRDRYFLTETGRARGFIIRHRCDEELHQLTVKAVAPDAEVRLEINLDLASGDQDATVDAWVGALGLVWQGALWKEIEVWHFDDCEVVHYVATAGETTVRCVEFEATAKPSLEHALSVLRKYETATGFASAVRTPASLLALLWPDVIAHLPAATRA